jgi:membrane-associated phospholipid phosphatase
MRYLTIFIFFSAIFSYLFLDKELAYFFYHKPEVLGEIFKKITFFGRSELYLIPSALIFIYYYKSKNLYKKIANYIFVSVALSGIIINIIKIIVARYRPVKLFEDELFGFSWFKIGHDFNSFPSGHSATALGFFTALALLYPKYRYLFISIGVVIASSRVVLDQHYLSDVLVGGFIGYLVSYILYKKYFGDRVGV